jgi:hypothetical protein
MSQDSSVPDPRALCIAKPPVTALPAKWARVLRVCATCSARTILTTRCGFCGADASVRPEPIQQPKPNLSAMAQRLADEWDEAHR